MKKSYHIKVKGADFEHLMKAFNTLGIKYDNLKTDLEGLFYDIVIDLTKYELLYLRLSCKGEILYIPVEQQQSFDQTVLQQS